MEDLVLSEYGTCWDFEPKVAAPTWSSSGSKSSWGRSSWGKKSQGQQSWSDRAGDAPLFAPPQWQWGSEGSGEPAMLRGKGSGGQRNETWAAAPAFDGPYIGDVTSEFPSWQQGKTRGRKGKGWESGDYQPSDAKSDWQGGRGKGQFIRAGPPPPPPVFEEWPSPGKDHSKGASYGRPNTRDAAPQDAQGKGKGKKMDSRDDPSKGKGAGSGGQHRVQKETAPQDRSAGGKSKGKKTSSVATQRQEKVESPVVADADCDKGGVGESARDETKVEVLAEIDALCTDSATLQTTDFDFRVRRYLLSIRTSGGRSKVRDALAMIQTFTQQKSRDSVKNWPAYLLTLLKRFEPDPFTKGGKGDGKSGADQSASEPEVPVAESGKTSRRQKNKRAGLESASAPTPVAVDASTEDAVEVVPVLDFLEEDLPEGWDEGRQAVLETISGSLGLGSAPPTCPFTSSPVDCNATLVSQITTCLAPGGSARASPHVVGMARSFELGECPRVAAAATATGQPELTALPEGAPMMAVADAAVVAMARGSAAAGTVLRELGLELAAQTLRNPKVRPAAK